MHYCTVEEVQIAAGGRDKLVELSDFENTLDIGWEEVARAVESAEQVIDSFIGKKNPTPLPEGCVPSPIPYIASRMAVINLREERHMVTEIDQRMHDKLMLMLENLRNCTLKLGTTEDSPNKPRAGYYPRPCEKDWSRKSMKGFV